ncbi:hypothetical protein [Epilithonimonas xixisoli]|uniref:DUF4251 domain-containing protein n=1 Tax=Epilithonimonas xixisoli TaxID=1476462 RepID=A0A4R8IFS0_9FLAO|nr:hypothetical protein [Epilithonimonas xixisoli]TDX84294.1 hypothetical protein B0I22_1906 [Epilithonimonas xixisoli]
MRLKIFTILSAILLLFSCQGDETETQTIDQVLKLYMKSSSNPDLLNPRIDGSFTNVALLDILGERDLTPVSGFSLLKDSDTITYLDYPAGAIRLKIDSLSNDNEQTYYSQFVLRLSRTQNSVVTNVDDTIKIEYKSTPSLFQISKLWYNGDLKFTKTQGQPNIVTIVK